RENCKPTAGDCQGRGRPQTPPGNAPGSPPAPLDQRGGERLPPEPLGKPHRPSRRGGGAGVERRGGQPPPGGHPPPPRLPPPRAARGSCPRRPHARRACTAAGIPTPPA